MDDTLKSVIYGFLGLVVFHAALERRATNDAARQVREAFNRTGVVRATVEARGMFGAYVNRFYAVDVYGRGITTDRLPFVTVPRAGWKGSIKRLRLHFDDLILKGLPVDRFEADVPDVTYDIGRALYQDRLVVRGAGEGPAAVRIVPDGLRTFILRKYSRIVRDAEVTLCDRKVVITGKLLLFGGQSPFVATGELDQRQGRYLDLVRPVVLMNGRALPDSVTANVLKQINPVLDVSADLGLTGYLKLSRVVIGDDAITVYGLATIPPIGGD